MTSALLYDTFLANKSQYGSDSGFDPIWLPEFLFDFQTFLADWSIRKGRNAVFADCGLGKTAIQQVWAENVVRRTNRPALILTPLAVTQQAVEEGVKFGIEVERSRDGKFRAGAHIVVANYERLHYFNPQDFAGVVCDESSAIKSFAGERRDTVTEFMRTVPYRLLCTATAAPNDYIELGTSSEALGELGHMDMLNRFFKNDQNTSDIKSRLKGYAAPRKLTSPGWRFKGHAENAFWRWVCSWARACRKPSDLGFEDGPFTLPRLTTREHAVRTNKKLDGMLFSLPTLNL